jgi:hypothetical protein
MSRADDTLDGLRALDDATLAAATRGALWACRRTPARSPARRTAEAKLTLCWQACLQRHADGRLYDQALAAVRLEIRALAGHNASPETHP